MTVPARAPTGRYSWACVLAGLATLLTACSSSHPSTITSTGGSTQSVAISSSTGNFQVQQGAQLLFTATVPGDSTNAGVTWSVSGGGALSNETKTTATYTAPTGITGTSSPIVTATSIANNKQIGVRLLAVLGTPIINPIDLFPGYVGSSYTAQVSVAGGLTPFVWAASGGTLPPGITLATSTVSLVTLTGTPTTVGVYNFQLKTTDKNSAVATVDLTIIVKAATACLLEGQHALLYSGFVSGQVAVGATSLNVSSTGSITGYHDFNAPGGVPIAETLTGTCATRTANNGILTITGLANSPVFNFAVTVGLVNGRIQLLNGGDSQSGTGPLEKQQPADFVLAKLAGDFSFGALGGQADGSRAGLVGALSIDANGVITTGHADSNESQPMTDAALTGALTAPDANGRGTLKLTAGGSGGNRTLHFVYYVVTADRLYIASIDTGTYFAGFMTRQIGPLSNSSLADPAILSLWGAVPVFSPKTVMSLGRFSGANTSAGTINLILDTADANTNTLAQGFSGGSFAVRADGRTRFSFTSGATTRGFVAYLSGPASGYLIEPGSASGGAGLIEAQAPGPFSAQVPGLFVSGAQYPEDQAPIILQPSVHFANGAFVTSSITGIYTIDSATGHGAGTLAVTGIGNADYSFYIVRPDKVLALRLATPFFSAGISWLNSN